MNIKENDNDLYFSFIDFIKIKNKYFKNIQTNYRIDELGSNYVNEIYDPNIFQMLFLKVEKKLNNNFNYLSTLKMNSLFIKKLNDFKKLGVVKKNNKYIFADEFKLENDNEIILSSINGSRGFKFSDDKFNYVVITEDNIIYYFRPMSMNIPYEVIINNITYNFKEPNLATIPEETRKWGNVNNVILFNKNNNNVINLVTLEKNDNFYIYLKFNINLEETKIWGDTPKLNDKENQIVENEFKEIFLIKKVFQ